MASLIISIKNEQLEFIDPAKGLYLFGISRVNENTINESTYQLSNRFDNLVPGLYNWYVKEITTQIVRASGSNIVKNNDTNDCYTKFVNNINLIIIPKLEHKKDIINDIECFIDVNGEYFKFIPDSAIIEITGQVTVTTFSPFKGKITLC
jgi:hypothetical protein